MNDFLDQLASYLDAQGVGVFDVDAGRNIFVDNQPPSPVNQVSLHGLPGGTIGPQREVAELRFPRFQAIIRNASYTAGSDKLDAVRAALHGLYGVALPNWRVLRCHAEQEGGPIGKNDMGYFEYSINFTAEVNGETAP